MQELEKILEEIEMKKKKCLDIVRVEIDPMEITIHREQYKGLRMAEDIIRKHMNDGWIPTKERMPTKEECERDNIRFLISVGTDCWYSTEIAKCSWVEADNADGTDGSYSEFWIDQFPHIYRPSHRLIAAWKILELPEPYIPRKER